MTVVDCARWASWAAEPHRTFSPRRKDPQFVVIDEVSGQILAYRVAIAPLNWKYLLLGFILFRVFDIWKPFPARQAESLPGGWGIMADDWVAGFYAAMDCGSPGRVGLSQAHSAPRFYAELTFVMAQRS